MKRTLVLLAICACTHLGVQAQINLVKNPSFEDTLGCPRGLTDGVALAHYWNCLDTTYYFGRTDRPTWGGPEFCHACFDGGTSGIPHGFSYTQYPRTGNGMMQLLTMVSALDTYSNARDYLQGQLKVILDTGHTYEVSFYVCAEEHSFYCNNLGAYVDDGTIDTTHRTGVPQTMYTPQVLDTAIITDTLNWTKISGTFVANGTEAFITLGNFFGRARTRTQPSMVPYYGTIWDCYSFYLFDDVSVIDCANEPLAGIDTTLHVGDTVHLGPNETTLPYTWYQQGSITPIDSGGGITVHPSVTTTYILKQDLCGVVKYDTVTITVHNLGLAQPGHVLDDVAVFPTPAQNELQVHFAAGTQATLSDVWGHTVLQQTLLTDKETISIAHLPTGNYLLTLSTADGERVVKRVVKE
ncbi:MAG: T9SS C-terminal target domain-containing protein [Chitinophagia bacterium]|nr:T9SS C-terminal target domain-containing protein [Chitinophagia bacterium]